MIITWPKIKWLLLLFFQYYKISDKTYTLNILKNKSQDIRLRGTEVSGYLSGIQLITELFFRIDCSGKFEFDFFWKISGIGSPVGEI
jgi:hypothetical protein